MRGRAARPAGAWGSAGPYGDACESDEARYTERWAGPWDASAAAAADGAAADGRGTGRPGAATAPPRTCLHDTPYIPAPLDDKDCEMRVAGHHGCLTWHVLGFEEGYYFPKPQGWARLLAA